VSVLLNRSPLSIASPFTPPLPIVFDDATSGVNSTTGGSPQGLILEDMNRDGRPDVAVANAGDATVSLLLNVTAPGTFTPALATKVDFATGAGARAIATGDVNRDGKRDLAVTNETAGTVSILLGQ